MARLNIPSSAKRALISFVKLNDEQYAELVKAIEEASPDLYQGNLAAFIQERVTIEAKIVQAIVRVLLELCSTKLRSPVSIEDFADDVVDSLKGDASDEFEQIEIDWEKFKSHLVQVLGYEPLLITAKAYGVMMDHGHVYCNKNVRILTDIRPVFSSDVEGMPAAAVIVHTLRLAYHEGEDIKEVYVSLDAKDLHELRRLIERADKKADGLRSVIAAAKMQYLDPEVHEHSW